MKEIHNYDTVNKELLPCPFCGTTPHWYLIGQKDEIDKKRTVVIKCNTCGTEQRTSVLHLPTSFACEKAQENWNQRIKEDEK